MKPEAMTQAPNLTDKQVLNRLPTGLKKRLEAEFGPELKPRLERARQECPTDAGRAALRLLQLCGRVPTVQQVQDCLRSAPEAMSPTDESTPTD